MCTRVSVIQDVFGFLNLELYEENPKKRGCINSLFFAWHQTGASYRNSLKHKHHSNLINYSIVFLTIFFFLCFIDLNNFRTFDILVRQTEVSNDKMFIKRPLLTL